jgi:uncharacterized phiE125 gp8 family phage protein
MAIQSPITLDEMKDHLRITHTDDDQYINALCLAATSWAEKFQNRTYVKRPRTMVLDKFPMIIRPKYPPLISVTSIVYIDIDGAEQTLAASEYRVDTVTEPGRITEAYEVTWPDIRNVTNAVTITYVAGYGTEAKVPDEVKAAIKLMVGHLYEHREAVSEIDMVKVPLSVEHLLWLEKLVLV